MPILKKPRPPSAASVKRAADRAAGIGGSVILDPGAELHGSTDYNPSFDDQARKLCELGATDKELGEFFGVTTRSIYRWILKYPTFGQALKAGKVALDDRVERSLYHRATGYSYESEKIFLYQGEVVRAKTIEHVPPDTVSMIFWLKNRRPAEWRDKTEQVIKHEFGDLSATERDAALQAVNEAIASRSVATDAAGEPGPVEPVSTVH